jgi:hypothetical protein
VRFADFSFVRVRHLAAFSIRGVATMIALQILETGFRAAAWRTN